MSDIPKAKICTTSIDVDTVLTAAELPDATVTNFTKLTDDIASNRIAGCHIIANRI